MINECEKCNGQGVIEKDDRLFDCVCSFLRRVSFNMPPYVRRSPIEKEHLELPILSSIDKSLYVIGYWSDMKSIIKALFIKYPTKFIRITSDAEIRDVFVGSRSKASKTSDFIGDIYNNISDLMDSPSLCIVKLNEITYKNKAAAGALEEALLYRLDRDKPTWVFCNLDRKFNSSSYAYSDSISNLIGQNYSRATIPEINQSVNIESLDDQPTRFNAMSSKKVKKKVESEPQPKEDISDMEIELEEVLEEETVNLSDRYGTGVKQAPKKSFNPKGR